MSILWKVRFISNKYYYIITCLSVESTDTFPGAANTQLELGGQINLVVAENGQALTSVLGASMHAQALSNTLGSGRLMDTSSSTDQTVPSQDESSESKSQHLFREIKHFKMRNVEVKYFNYT